MLQTAIVYTSLAFGMFFFTKIADRYVGVFSNISYWIPVLLFTIIFGIRYGVGVDYFAYMDIYENWNIGDLRWATDDYGFAFICDLCTRLGLSLPIFFSIFSFLQILFIYLAFRERKLVLAYSVLALFFTGIGISGFNNIIRQAVSFCIFVYALTFIEKKQVIYYFLCVLLATLFHLSAVILFPIYFLFNRGQNYFQDNKLQFIILVCCYVVSWLGIGNLISSYVEYFASFLGYDGYFMTHFVDAKGRSAFDIVVFFVNLLLVYYYPKVVGFYEDRFFKIIYILYFVSTCLGYLFVDIAIVWRILCYFSYMRFIVYGYYLLFFIKTIKYSYLNFFCSLFFIFYLFGFYCYSTLYRSYNSCSTYATYFQKELYIRQEGMNYDYMNN